MISDARLREIWVELTATMWGKPIVDIAIACMKQAIAETKGGDIDARN